MIGINLRIIESTAACSFERVRTYAKRRAKSVSHWCRMDKKYSKRYGIRTVPTAYIMGDALIVHPSLAPEYRAAINKTFTPRTRERENWL